MAEDSLLALRPVAAASSSPATVPGRTPERCRVWSPVVGEAADSVPAPAEAYRRPRRPPTQLGRAPGPHHRPLGHFADQSAYQVPAGRNLRNPTASEGKQDG